MIRPANISRLRRGAKLPAWFIGIYVKLIVRITTQSPDIGMEPATEVAVP